MKFKLPNIKIIKNIFSPKIIFSLLLLVFFTGTIFLGLFLYKNFYQTITQSQEIIVLRAEVSPYTVNVEKFKTALAALEKKLALANKIDWQEIKNPFGFTPIIKSNNQGID